MHSPAGRHLLADLDGVKPSVLSDADKIRAILVQGAEQAGATVLFSHIHGFGAGQGVTGVVLLAESHISIHTWPECGFAAVDIFMCGAASPDAALAHIVSALEPASHTLRTVVRQNATVPGGAEEAFQQA
jgi:S-adenosylmethionine decarboxylase